MLFRPVIAAAAALAALFCPPVLRETGDAAVARAVPGSFAGVYDFHLGGIWGGEIVLDARLAEGRYHAEAAGRVTGVVSMVWNAGFAAATEGVQADAEGFVPDRFEADAYSGGRSQKVAVNYDRGRPSAVAAEPPFDPKPWEIEPTAQTGAFDPLSAVLAGLALQTRAALCNRTVEIYDGRRRYAVDLGAPEQVAEGIRCPAEYRRVAGFKPKLMARPAWPFDIWFAKGPDGLWHVRRAMGAMPFGMAAVTLRGG